MLNNINLMGRLTKDPDVRYAQGSNTCIARYTLAVDRRFKRDGDPDADFINCVAFGKQGEFAEKWFKKGIKINAVGRIQTGNYTNKDGARVNTFDIIIEEQEFAESKSASGNAQPKQEAKPKEDDFVPADLGEDLPFH